MSLAFYPKTWRSCSDHGQTMCSVSSKDSWLRVWKCNCLLTDKRGQNEKSTKSYGQLTSNSQKSVVTSKIFPWMNAFILWYPFDIYATYIQGLTNRFSNNLSDLDFSLSIIKLRTRKPLADQGKHLPRGVGQWDLSAPDILFHKN